MIEKIDIDMFENATEADYTKARAEFIATKNYSSFWGGGRETNPVRAEADWNAAYPEGYESWKEDQYFLNARGEQEVIDKVNEIIEFLNKPTPVERTPD